MSTRFAAILAIVVGLACLAPAAFAAQDGTITFSPPVTGGAPTGYRLYRDSTLVGTVSSGQTLTALFPNDVGVYQIGVEAFNATGAGPRVTQTVTLGAVVPGPVTNLKITLNCATTSPPTCTVTVQ
jgi:hypothetical protein